MNLSKKQSYCLDILETSNKTRIIFGGGAGGGKSILGCYWILKQCFKYPNTRWLIGRAVLKTLKDTTLVSLFEVMKMQGITVDMYRYNQQQNNIRFNNGSEIMLKDLFYYPSDANFDQLGSLEITGGFIDECNQINIKAWDIVGSRIRYKLDENNLIPRLLGTCNPSKNWVYHEFYKPSKDGNLEDNKIFIQSLLQDNPHISQHYKTNLLSIKDQQTKERLLHGNWEYDSNPFALIDYDNIIVAFDNPLIMDGELYLSCDIARFGDDKTVIVLWSGLKVIKIYEYSKQSTVQTTTKIKQLAREYNIKLSNIIVDEDGVGGGIKDQLGNCKGFINNSRAIGRRNYQNLKTQCYYLLSEVVNEQSISISCDSMQKEKIIQELEQVISKDTDKDGKLKIISKDEVKRNIGRSPDYSDAIMLRMYYVALDKLKPKAKVNIL